IILMLLGMWIPDVYRNNVVWSTRVVPSQESYYRSLALNFSETQDDWVPVIEEFFGVEMVLVPVGCFMMGGETEIGDYSAQPVHEQCITEPFWIDRFEVTNEQYRQFDTLDYPIFDSEHWEQPVQTATWTDAYEYCRARGMTLPSELEWEYTARGVNSLVYPWGNEFIADYVVFNSDAPDVVGRRLEARSWVGAVDMIGNISEWTSSFGLNYPYDPSDGRETVSSYVIDGVFPDIIVRGGTYNNNEAGLAAYIRYEAKQNSAHGIRCVARVL
ncbi:MAG: formylglycine-generating enzyme family protein, partial [Chloroflexota bacterium]